MIDLETINSIYFDFDGVFTDNTVTSDSSGNEWIKCSKYDSMGLTILKNYIYIKDLDISLSVITSEANISVGKRCKKLGLNVAQDINNKKEYIMMNLRKRNPNTNIENELKKSIFLGNDLNDLGAIKACGYSFVPSDSHPIIKREATVTLTRKGGDGFIREFIEYILPLEDIDSELLDQLIYTKI